MFDITLAAADLKVSLPEQFERLVEAFRKLEDKFQREFNAADAGVIYGAQGKVWMVSQLRARLEKCVEQKHQIENRA
jgi:hypothetical protein